MTLLDEIHSKRDEVLSLAQKYGVTDVRVFGSVARGEEQDDSDIDLLINVSEDSDAFGFLDFKREMRDLFNHNIDVVFEKGLFKPFLDNILQEAKLV